ncbi:MULTISPECIES: cytoplasmic protein [Shewanella]|uniref:Cytoplasmic protein n=1 Tax=Shewanella electrodiphila TaxID=934143 RepID=A0ABT0KMV1_9GAMM|nr:MULTISPECIES: cytoplasmic protein [Shewanella]MCC4832615.1 cytoplasmic protein [Shewanella sp. 10N.7]MCL1044861.1 cytoplasmic protein [Shewanella electrodiphila]PMG75042.1 cytoplasmic protein [Shewanella sp. 10N.286.51.B7]
MTAITHVYNYTVRCPHYKENEQPASWLNHVEVNQSSEIALNRITKWHDEPGTKAFKNGEFIVRKSNTDDTYYAMQSDRMFNNAHSLVTFKVFLDKCCQDADPEKIIAHLVEDYNGRLAKAQA